MPIEKWSEKVVVVHLADDPQFSDDIETLAEMAAGRRVDAVLDFSAVHFANSSNVGALLRLRKQMLDLGARLVLCGMGTQVWGVFLVTGLDKVFDLADDVPTGLATLQMEEP
jgi:anti-sigma B factor antagonist